MRELDAAHPDVSIGQHVDDVSNLVKAKTTDELVGKATRFAVHFKSIIDDLGMEISSNSTVVPNSAAAQRITKTLNKLNIPMKMDKTGVDI